MTRAGNALALLAAGAAAVLFSLPSAAAEPTDPVEPTDPSAPTASAEPSTAPLPGPAPEATAAADDCTAAGLASTISTVTAQLSSYFAAHPDVNQAMIDATRQPSFIAVGQFDDYFKNHPEEADAIRGIQAPYVAFKDRCGLQVAPTDALAVLAEV